MSKIEISAVNGFMTKIVQAKYPLGVYASIICELSQAVYVPDACEALEELNNAIKQQYKAGTQASPKEDYAQEHITTAGGHKVNYIWFNNERLFAAPDVCRAIGSPNIAKLLVNGFHIKRRGFGFKVPITWIPCEAIVEHAKIARIGNYDTLIAAIEGKSLNVHLSASALTHIKKVWFGVPNAQDRLDVTKSALDFIATLDPI
jgi:hypothetical protein